MDILVLQNQVTCFANQVQLATRNCNCSLWVFSTLTTSPIIHLLPALAICFRFRPIVIEIPTIDTAAKACHWFLSGFQEVNATDLTTSHM